MMVHALQHHLDGGEGDGDHKFIHPSGAERSFYSYMNETNSNSTDNAGKRSLILSAVIPLFRSHGFHGASMRDICSAAALSPGALYRYFPSKEAIIDAVVTLHLERWEEAFCSASQEPGFLDCLDYLTTVILREENLLDLPLWLEIVAEASRTESVALALRAHEEKMIAAISRVVVVAIASGEMTEGTNARDAAAMVLSIFDGLRLRRGSDREFDLRRALRLAVYTLSQAYGGRGTNTRIRRHPLS